MKTSLLENLTIERDRAEFMLDGHRVCISGDSRSPAFAALKELHEHALADYETHRAIAAQRRGILTRIGSWLGSFRRNRATISSPSVSNYAATSPQPFESNESTKPHLQSLFADENGVHAVWQETQTHSRSSADSAAAQSATQFTSRLDSELAHRLRRCFEALSHLGYKVNGIELLAGVSPSALRTASTKQSQTTPVTPPTTAHSVETNPVPEHTKAGPASLAAGVTTDAVPSEIVMRLHPPSADHPSRALVSPAEDSDKPEVLIASERVLRALHAAASTSRPLAERLTYLRCSRGEKGLRIVAVGFGEGAERAPSRWEDAKMWWHDAGKTLAANVPPESSAPSEATTAKLGPTFETGSAPLQQQRPPKARPNPDVRPDALAPEPG